ncbi:hypothetical protein N665_0594s0004 [Sinapis alba]|nr:hypothetical protein N665_0594s0004 [Sinapis alba]
MATSRTEDSPPTVTDGKASQGTQFGTKSYVKVVQQKHVLENHEIQVEVVEGTEMVEIPDDLLVNTVPLWEDFLEGRFLDPAPHVARIHIIVNKIWPLGNKNIKIDVFAVNEKTVKFRITDQQTRSRILRRGVWNIAGIPMILSKWAPLKEKKEEEDEVKTIPIWVTMKNVPASMFSWKGLGFIASSVGKPLRLHPETELCSSFEEAKVFVNANVTKPLPRAYRFRSKSGINANIEFIYPWIPTKCSCCGKWGHNKKECSHQEKDVMEKSAEQEKGRVDNSQTGNVEHVFSKEILAGKIMDDAVQKGVDIADTVEVSQAANSALPGIYQGESTGNANEQSSEVEENRVVTEETVKTIDISEKDWSNVSPGRAGRVLDKKQNSKTVISPSRFSLLAVEEDDQCIAQESEDDQSGDRQNEDMEEGEILIQEGSKELSAREEKDLKPIRSARVEKRVNSQSAATMKATKPSGTSKKRISKKH